MARGSGIAVVSQCEDRHPKDSKREPGWLQLVGVLEASALEKLAAEFGGTRLYIPRTLGRSTVLRRTISEEASKQLISLFGGERIYIPKDWRFSLRKLEWRSRVPALRARNLRVARVAKLLGCSERLVYKVLARSTRAR